MTFSLKPVPPNFSFPPKSRFVFLALLFLNGAFGLLFAQQKDIDLAHEYFIQQEYDKAAVLYERLAKSNRNLPLIYKNYLQTLIRQESYSEAEKLISKQIKLETNNPTFRIDYGSLFFLQGKADKAFKIYEEVIEDFKKDYKSSLLAAEHFVRLDLLDQALQMLLSGRKASREKATFALELAEVYALRNDREAMIDEYLLFALTDRSNLEYIKGALQDQLVKQDDFDAFEKILLEKLQKNSNESVYNELLLWLYLQQKRFYRAFIQAKALDKRYKLEGNELLNIGLISLKNKDYKSAQTIFKYIIDTYPNSANYPLARNYYIKAKEEVVKNTFPIEESSIYSLIEDYQKLIQEVGKNTKTFDALRSVASLYAFYLDQKDTAVVILEEAIGISRGRTDYIAQCKTDLGDIYLLKDEPWEATLLYSQVEKLKKEHPIGYEAKLRNAKLSYYKGEFELAQEHLDILKEATSREIANDAMDLSLLIQDNLAFDTTGAALKDYSVIDLMIFQHQDEKALANLDQMLDKYPGHSIEDEVLWRKANMLLKLGQPDSALTVLQKIVETYPDGILGDDAFFLLGKTFEETLKDTEKAKEIYEELLVKYPGSIFTAEARKRFRILRGDIIN